jgi:hypothetical protein
MGILVLLLTTSFSYWIAADNFALPTGFATAFVLLALLVLGKLPSSVSLVRARPNFSEGMLLFAIVGPLLAASLLFRITSLFVIYGAVAIGVVLSLWGFISQIYYRKKSDASIEFINRRRRNDRFAFRLLLISVIPILVMLGWSWEVTSKAHPSSFNYTVSVPGLAAFVWRPDNQLVETGNPWLLDASANWACRIDKETCLKIAKAESLTPSPWTGTGAYSSQDYERLALISAVKNPVGYLMERTPKVWRIWSSDNAAQGILLVLTSINIE